MTHKGSFLEDPVPLLLADTTGNNELHMGIHMFQGPVSAKGTVEFLLGLLPDATGIDDDYVRIRRSVGGETVFFLQKTGDFFGIMDIHLASEGLDEIFFHGLIIPE